MKKIDVFAWAILALLFVLAGVVLPRLTEDAMGILVGLAFGTLGVLPVNLLALHIWTKQRAQRQPQTPRTIAVINPKTGERLLLEVEPHNLLTNGGRNV